MGHWRPGGLAARGKVSPSSDRKPDSRTAVAIDEERKLLFLAVGENISPRLMLQKLADLGAKRGHAARWRRVKLDGHRRGRDGHYAGRSIRRLAGSGDPHRGKGSATCWKVRRAHRLAVGPSENSRIVNGLRGASRSERRSPR